MQAQDMSSKSSSLSDNTKLKKKRKKQSASLSNHDEYKQVGDMHA